jgi:hypothetical protein
MDSHPELKRALACVSTGSCRRGIDQIRIVATGDTVCRAEELMHHLRDSSIVEGSADSTRFRRWVKGYWVIRHSLIYVVREELGFGTAVYEPLDSREEQGVET